MTKKENLKLNIMEYKNNKIVLDSLPVVAFVELTRNCNLKCEMCKHKTIPYTKDLNMSRDTFHLVANKIFPTSKIVDLRGYGESTIIPDLEYFIEETLKYKNTTRLITNGVSIRQQTLDLLMQSNGILIFTINSLKQNNINELKCAPSKNLLTSIEKAVETRNKYKKGRIIFVVIATSLTFFEIPKIVSLASKYKIDRIKIHPVMISEKHPFNLKHVDKKIDIVLQEAVTIAKRKGLELRIGSALRNKNVIKKSTQKMCIRPWSYVYINYKGDVGFCDHNLNNENYMISNIHNNDFLEIWNHQKIQDVRNIHINKLFNNNCKINGCSWCYKYRYIDFEDETHKFLSPLVVSTKTIL